MKKVLWLTGLSGSGKTTIALRLKERLEHKEILILDGDIVRETLHKNLSFSREDIRKNNRIIAELAKQKISNHDLVVVPVISPFIEDRKMAKEIIGDHFVEVFINRSIKSCIANDVKGLYKKALDSKIENFIGISKSTPYELPKNPDIELMTEIETIDQSVDNIIRAITNLNS